MKSSSRALTRGAVRTLQPKTPAGTLRLAYTCHRCLSQTLRKSSSNTTKAPNLQQFFTAPTWSVRSLLSHTTTTPSTTTSSSSSSTLKKESQITPKTLHHLLRLSALPPPATPEEEESMLSIMHTQLQFVRDIQSVDTTGVEPLRAIRDETSAGLAETTITLDRLRDGLDRETVFGYRRRPRRVRTDEARERSGEELLVDEATEERRERGYFVVESGKVKGGE